MAVKAADIPFSSNGPTDQFEVTDRIFRERGEGRYSLELEPVGITLEVERLRREHHALHGELAVSVRPGALPHARTFDEQNYLSIGDLNFSAPRTISERAKILAERARMESLDWYGFLAEFVHRVTAAERKGKPALVLADGPETDEAVKDTWDIEGFPVLTDLPMILFGAGSSGKSYLAMWLAGRLALMDVPVLYCDWEFAVKDHRKRFGKLFKPMPKNVYYVRCERPLVDEIDRICRLIRTHQIGYVIFDSMVFALNGPANDEFAGAYFRAARETRLGGLHLAHTAKGSDDPDKEKTVFGSIFFSNGARSIWYCTRTENNQPGEHNIGLFHRKNNVGELLKPRGFRLLFRGDRTLVERVAVDEVDELAAKLPPFERIVRALQRGPMAAKALAEDLDLPIGTVRSILSRNKSKFVKVGMKVGLLGDGVDF